MRWQRTVSDMVLGAVRDLKRRLASLGHIKVDEAFEHLLINQGRLWTASRHDRAARHLHDHEFRVFSQWGEDGIIQFLTREVAIAHRTFIEFGVEDFSESNCRFLMMNDNWRGLVLDGSPRHIATIEASYYFWRYDLTARAVFIDRDNINTLIAAENIDEDLGLLSVDIDGMDYWVLSAINVVKPRILIVETNSLLGEDRAISVPYDAGFQRDEAHSSGVYYGASLAAFRHWASLNGYTFVGTTSIGSNAFFVRTDLMTPVLHDFAATAGFIASGVREGRRADGRLSLKRGDARLAVMRGMPVVNVVTGAIEPF
jgi:hypothetical protein